ncbi:MAG: 4-carboxy-4-hydroxy-2-oxoadipate aldolase/oxaloacetate decarboxylase [Propionibacteriaceae bacterium]|nr:4-carboxy-4-hydroxy-2-oxoadipate aldolase/oxaloacetate decarboxylase [Propionibacteriaceae bacterium]
MADTAVSQELLDKLGEIDVATLYEASGLDCAMDPAIRPVWHGSRIVGRALPLRTHPADNLPLHIALELAQPGDVLVVDGRQELCGYWGEVLAVAAQERGVRGLVIDGGCRDVDRLEELGFPVFSRGVSVRRTGKNFRGRINETLVVAGVSVSPGDAVVADVDGVVVLPPSAVEPTLASSAERMTKEAGFLDRIRGGELTLDLYGFRNNG